MHNSSRAVVVVVVAVALVAVVLVAIVSVMVVVVVTADHCFRLGVSYIWDFRIPTATLISTDKGHECHEKSRQIREGLRVNCREASAGLGCSGWP